MHRRRRSRPRPGTSLPEFAIVSGVTLLLLLGLITGGLGVFRYQEVAALAREAARYASTHGNQYRKDAALGTGTPGTSTGSSSGGFLWYQANPSLAAGADTSWTQDVYDNAVGPRVVGLSPGSLTCQVGWPPVINEPSKPDNWPGSQVRVTVSYQWFPEVFLVGPITLSSTSSMPITN
jgi:Flp pilus assembly protein TadG